MKLPIISLPSLSRTTSTAASCSVSTKSWHMLSHMLFMSVVVVALLPNLVVDIQALPDTDVEEGNIQEGKKDESRHRDVDHQNRLPEVRNSDFIDKPHERAGYDDRNINTINNIRNNNNHPAAAAATSSSKRQAEGVQDRNKSLLLAQPLQFQSVREQEKEKVAADNKRHEEIDNREKNMIVRQQQQVEERERALGEHIKEQEERQAKNREQNLMDTQREQQREQKWLMEVHKKSQNVLAERQQKQQQQQNPQVEPAAASLVQDVHNRQQEGVNVDEHPAANQRQQEGDKAHEHPAVNQGLDVRNRRQEGVNVDNERPAAKQEHDAHNRPQERAADIDKEHSEVKIRSNVKQINNADVVNNDVDEAKDNKHNDIDNNNLHLNKNDIVNPPIMTENRVNISRQEPAVHNSFVLSGQPGNVQIQVNQNREVNPAPVEELDPVFTNRLNNSDVNKKAEQLSVEAGNIFNGSQTDKEDGNILNPNLLQVPVIGNDQNNNVNNARQGEQEVNIQSNSQNLNNNNNQWPKYEFNNAQQQQQQQLQQQQQQQQQQQPQIGGINLSWDWEDFSVMFNSYGAAEMKVRRSPHPTTGEPWPLPQYYSKKIDKIYKISKELHFIPTGVKCDILEEGLTRHLQRTLRGCVEDMYDNLQNAEGSPIEDPALRYERNEFLKAPVITRVEVRVRKPCEKYPSLESDESYDLVVKKRKTYIWANEVWGALRGLETFGQLVWRGTDGFIYIKETVISDYPRFPHRGLHIDTSRHFLFKEVILDILDSMEMNKLNVFHWHIVDDQSFPYESKVYPELSRKGAFHPTYVYTLEDIADIIEYARLRAIRVMPEFDTPGHTFAWGLSRPELLTQCYSGNLPVKGYLGPIDPSKNSTYRFLQTLFKEIVEVFKDQYLHLGGDEVPLGCWQSNPEVVAFAQELAKRPKEFQQGQGPYVPNSNFGGWSMWSDDIRRVYEYYENRLINIVSEIGQKRKKGIKYVMWQEVMNNNLQLPNDTIIQVWMGDMADVMRATSMGYQVIYSTCWYMDHIEYGTKWPKYYNCDPVDQSFGYHIDEKKVLGGEAAFWAEYFSNENLIPLMWPRASAAAERLWSNKEVKNLDKAAERLAEHRCRMIKRGINAGEINGPGYCLHAPPKRRLFNDTAGCKGGNCSRTHNFVQIEDFEVHLSHRGGSLADCGNVFRHGNGNVFILLTLALIVVVALYALSKSSTSFHRMRICKNRSILLVFVGVLLVYILCYTTIWMRAFEFSGSFHKTLQEDNRQGGAGGSNEEDSNNFRPISS